MWPDLAKWVLLGSILANDAKAQAKLTLIWPIFTYVFTFIFIWLLSNPNIVWHRNGCTCQICFNKYTCNCNISLIYTTISDIYFYVHVAIATFANK